MRLRRAFAAITLSAFLVPAAITASFIGSISPVVVVASSAPQCLTTTIAAGVYHSLAVKSDGTVWGWGQDTLGQLGNGSFTGSSSPVQASITSVVAVAAHADNSLALKSDGTVWAWGDNTYGQLGNGGSVLWSTTPVQVNSQSSVVSIAAGAGHALAAQANGTVWSWGDNEYGQLGNGTGANSSTPLLVPNLLGAVSVAAGESHSIVLKYDGSVWAFGLNSYGQLGNGTNANSATPVAVTGLSTVVAIAAYGWHSLAVKSDGTVWAWGYNVYGQLGNGTTSDSTIPVQVSGVGAATRPAGGGDHSLTVNSGGTLSGWGWNSVGQLGNGGSGVGLFSSTPTAVSNLTGVSESTAGWAHSLGLKSDGTLWSWGDNEYGQLGDGTLANRSIPVQVSGISGIAQPGSPPAACLTGPPAAPSDPASLTCQTPQMAPPAVPLSSARLFAWNQGSGAPIVPPARYASPPGVTLALPPNGWIGPTVLALPRSSAAGASPPQQPTVAEHDTWVQRASDGQGPQARLDMAVATSPTGSVDLLFGGVDGNSNVFGDTWKWDGSYWTQLHPSGSPSPRRGATLAVDSTRNLAVLFGGADNTHVFGDTWTWNGSDWQQANPTTRPAPREGARMAFDKLTGNLLLFGGETSSGAYADTWLWDGSNWTALNPATSPPPRANGGLIYDPVSGKDVLFGGDCGGSQYPRGDTWLWDGANWRQFTGTPAPTPRSFPSMSFNVDTQTTFLFGGTTANGPLSDTFIWDGSSQSWSVFISTTVPNPRAAAGSAYDPTSQTIMLFGGAGVPAFPYGDTWSTDHVLPGATLNKANLTYNGGPVDQTTTNYVILWQPAGTSMASSYASKISQFFSDIGSSSLFNAMTQYYQISGGNQQPVQRQATLGAVAWTDTNPYPETPVKEQDVRNEVTRAMSLNGWIGGVGKEFFVYTAKGVVSVADDGSMSFTNFCAFHNAFMNNGTLILYADMPYLDPQNASLCQANQFPNDPSNHEVDSVLNTSSHELFETVTDPTADGRGWCDNYNSPPAINPLNAFGTGSCSNPVPNGKPQGGEIGDKCNFRFGPESQQGNVAINGHSYDLQLEWSNRVNGCSRH